MIYIKLFPLLRNLFKFILIHPETKIYIRLKKLVIISYLRGLNWLVYLNIQLFYYHTKHEVHNILYSGFY